MVSLMVLLGLCEQVFWLVAAALAIFAIITNITWLNILIRRLGDAGISQVTIKTNVRGFVFLKFGLIIRHFLGYLSTLV